MCDAKSGPKKQLAVNCLQENAHPMHLDINEIIKMNNLFFNCNL